MGIVDKINYLKARDNMTSDDVAQRSGVPIGTLNKILSGETQNPTGKTASKIARVFGETAEYLLNDDIPIFADSSDQFAQSSVGVSFSQNLKSLMEQKGISTAELSRLTGLTETAISDYKNGKKEPRGRQSVALAKALNVSLDVLWNTDFAKTDDFVTIKKENASIPTDVSPEALNEMTAKVANLLEYLGVIEPGGAPSDEDTAFIIGLIHMIQAYRDKGKG